MDDKKRERPKHLGRGLQSLLGPLTVESAASNLMTSKPADSTDSLPDKELNDSLKQISLTDISPNPYQPRQVWNEQELQELTDSIKANGIIQPIVVRPNGSGYQIIAGERRFRAAQLASLPAIPALIRQATDSQLLEWALVENIHRTNLNPIERAKAYQNYVTTFSLNQTEAAQRLGEDRSVVANFLRLLDLPEEVKVMLIENQLSMGHARAILALPTDDLRRKLANRAMAGRLSVREVERLVRQYLSESGKQKSTPISKAPHIMDLEKKLTEQLGTKVIIEAHKNGQRGKIVIEFYSLDEFDRIAERLGFESLDNV